MKWNNHLIFALLSTLAIAPPAFAESKRIEVYPLTQNYWDTQAGETLGEIVAQLLPHNFHLQQKLMAEIVGLNPEVFQDGDAGAMLAGKRLWLPNNLPQMGGKAEPRRVKVESFSWGSIKRPRR